MKKHLTYLLTLVLIALPSLGWAWHDETHLAIAKVAGYTKWYNATGADMSKIKAGNVERKNHYVNNPPGTVVTPQMVLEQVSLYNKPDDEKGHLYGAIIGSLREYKNDQKEKVNMLSITWHLLRTTLAISVSRCTTRSTTLTTDAKPQQDGCHDQR
jgi:hypothetical protein